MGLGLAPKYKARGALYLGGLQEKSAFQMRRCQQSPPLPLDGPSWKGPGPLPPPKVNRCVSFNFGSEFDIKGYGLLQFITDITELFIRILLTLNKDTKKKSL